MIVGAAQIVFNVADLEAAAAPYRERGWSETFRVDRLPNHPAKAPFQGAARNELDMLHLTPPEAGTAVEFTSYGGGPPAGSPAFTYEGGAAAMLASEPAASRALWGELGFAERSDGAMEFTAMVPAWSFALALHETDVDGAGSTTVDAEGLVLVTVLSTAIERDLARLEATGRVLRSTAPWTERIGDRDTTVAIVEGPSGELVELLQAPRRATHE